MRLGSRLIFLSTKVASWGIEVANMATILREGGPSLCSDLIFLFQNLVMASIFKKGMSHRATGLVIFARGSQLPKSAITALSVRRPVRRTGASPVESLRHHGGMRDEPFVPFTELEFFRDVSLVFALKLDYWAVRINFQCLEMDNERIKSLIRWMIDDAEPRQKAKIHIE
jgi:hypothetical protein